MTPRRLPSHSPRATRSRSARHKVPGTRDAQKAAVRQRIVTAALALFEERGFDATTTKAIAQRAKIAEGTIFNYFPTKDDIALHFFEVEVDHAIEAVRHNERLHKAPLEEKLFALLQLQLEYLSPYEHFISGAFVSALKPLSALRVSPRATDIRQRYLAFVEELIAEDAATTSGSILSWLAPSAFWLYYLGVLLYWLHDDSQDKQKTLAFLDRSVTFGIALLRQGTF